jgi:peptidoglycan/xylan/chitin deacetylase (PgdA/CDA1 family)
MRRFLKYIFHNIVCYLLLKCRLDLLFQSRSKNKRLIIMYHGVRVGNKRINGRHITAWHFEKQLQYFKKNFAIASLHELCAMKAQGILPGRCTIALTFDDGFLNNLTVALPLLEKYKIPATFFICTAGITDAQYAHPTDRVDLIRMSSTSSLLQIGDESFYRRGQVMVGQKSSKHAYHYLINLPYAEWLRMNDSLAAQLDEKSVAQNSEVYHLMSDQDVKDLVNNELVDLGSHAHQHVSFRTLTTEETQFQLLASRNVLEGYRKHVDAIAFPYGHFNLTSIALAKETGYRYLIAGGHVDPPFDKDVFPRIGVLDGAGFSYTMLMISNGFRRFGF